MGPVSSRPCLVRIIHRIPYLPCLDHGRLVGMLLKLQSSFVSRGWVFLGRRKESRIRNPEVNQSKFLLYSTSFVS